MGFIVLEGGAEFGGKMSEPDRRAMQLAGGPASRICILPTAAAADHNHRRAGTNGLRWFQHLGATQVEIVFVIDRASASDPELAGALRNARLIYMLGGFPRYLADTLRDTPAWQAALAAHQAGAVIAGSSAGAMILCSHVYDPYRDEIVPGLNLLPNTCLLPHHNTDGKHWAEGLAQLLPGVLLIGMDERTGMDNGAGENTWTVSGQGAVTMYSGGKPQRYLTGQTFHIPGTSSSSDS